jgi:hypothetical protein
MVTHNVTINVESGSYVTLVADAILIKRPSELAPALRQRAQPIVIENRDIEVKFRRYLFLERLTRVILIGSVAHMMMGALQKAIEKDFKIEASIWHEWKINKTGGSITLTPTKPEKPTEMDTGPKPNS